MSSAAQTTTPDRTSTATAPAAEQPAPKGEVAIFERPRLPWHPAIADSFGEIGVTKATWKALIDAVFPSARTVDSIILALSYCKARKLDPFKRPVHIVPVWSTERGGYVDTVWPGISELRTTAVRTGLFGGFDPAVFGPMKKRTFTGTVGRNDKARTESVELSYPEWCQITVYRMINNQRMAITGPRVYWEETYATVGRSELPNEMWRRRVMGQIEKCAEAAALRRAFPEELGSEYAAEEVSERFYNGATIEGSATPVKAEPVARTAQDALDTLVGGGGEQTAVKETPHDPETGEVIEQQTRDVGEAVLAEEVAAEAADDAPYAEAEKSTAGLIASLTDPEFKTAAELDEFKTRGQDVIKSFAIAEEQRAVLLGRFNAALLERKRKLDPGAAKKGR